MHWNLGLPADSNRTPVADAVDRLARGGHGDGTGVIP
jgi:hypothetical protein